MSEDMPEDMPDHVPEDMPDRMPNRMSEDMSDRMPEDLPVRKRINVMVGITRSKVICFFSHYVFCWFLQVLWWCLKMECTSGSSSCLLGKIIRISNGFGGRFWGKQPSPWFFHFPKCFRLLYISKLEIEFVCWIELAVIYYLSNWILRKSA